MTRDARLETEITLGELNGAVGAATEAIGNAITRTLALAGVGPDRIDTLILTGGSTRVPAVANELRARVPAARPVETDAFGSVGLGLAIDASRRFA